MWRTLQLDDSKLLLQMLSSVCGRHLNGYESWIPKNFSVYRLRKYTMHYAYFRSGNTLVTIDLTSSTNGIKVRIRKNNTVVHNRIIESIAVTGFISDVFLKKVIK